MISRKNHKFLAPASVVIDSTSATHLMDMSRPALKRSSTLGRPEGMSRQRGRVPADTLVKSSPHMCCYLHRVSVACEHGCP